MILRLPFKRKISAAATLLFILTGSSPAETPSLPEDLHTGMLTVSDLIYKEDFDAAEAESKKMVRRHSAHPAGYFCMGIVIDSWMARYQSNSRENEFYRWCDMAIDKGEQYLRRNGRDEWVSFFIGGADGYKGTYEARYERWITAFRYGWKGVSVLLDLRSSGCTIADISYGLGSYNYWRSALMKMLWWMPGIDDRRIEGIEQLRNAREKGVYTRTTASVALIDVLLNERRFGEALEIAEDELKQYPGSTLFTLGKARALCGMGEYIKADPLFRMVIERVEQDPDDNHYTAAQCRLSLMRMLVAEKKFVLAISEYNIVTTCTFDPSIKKRAEPLIDEMKSLYKQSMDAIASNK